MFGLLCAREQSLLHIAVFVATLICGGSFYVVSTYAVEFNSPDRLQRVLVNVTYQNEFFAQLVNALGYVLLPASLYSCWHRDCVIYVAVGAVWFYMSVAWTQQVFVPSEERVLSMLADMDGLGHNSGSCAGGGVSAADLADKDQALRKFVLLCACRCAMNVLMAVFLAMAARFDTDEDTVEIDVTPVKTVASSSSSSSSAAANTDSDSMCIDDVSKSSRQQE